MLNTRCLTRSTRWSFFKPLYGAAEAGQKVHLRRVAKCPASGADVGQGVFNIAEARRSPFQIQFFAGQFFQLGFNSVNRSPLAVSDVEGLASEFAWRLHRQEIGGDGVVHITKIASLPAVALQVRFELGIGEVKLFQPSGNHRGVG